MGPNRIRLEDGSYRYKVVCPDCSTKRYVWDKQVEPKRCIECAAIHRRNSFSRVYPCHCTKCDKSMIVKTKPKVDGVATCDYCKGKYGGVQAVKKEVKKKDKIKCSECSKKFEPRTKLIKACSSTCSKTRQKRIERESRPKRVKKIKKSTRTKQSELVLSKPKQDKVILGGVDKKEKPIYIRAVQKKTFQFRKEIKINGLTDNELSSNLIDSFLSNGNIPSVKFEDAPTIDDEGYTDCIRGGPGGY